MQKAHQLTLIAEIVDVLRPERQLGPGYDIREMTDQDVSELADLYFAAYSPEIVKDLPAARAGGVCDKGCGRQAGEGGEADRGIASDVGQYKSAAFIPQAGFRRLDGDLIG